MNIHKIGPVFYCLVLVLVGCAPITSTVRQATVGPTTQLSQADANTITSLPTIEGEFSPQVLYQLLVAEFAVQRGQLDIGVKNYQDAANATKDLQIVRRATKLAIYAKRPEKAVEAASLWIEIAPESLEARQHLAPSLLKIGNVTESLAQFEMIIALSKDGDNENLRHHPLMLIAAQLAQQRNRSWAMNIMSHLVNKRLQQPVAHFAKAHLAMRQANFELAIQSLEKALQLRPAWPKAIILKARTVAMQGNKQKAIEILESNIAGDFSDSFEVRMAHARMLMEVKNYEKAHAAFDALLEMQPNNPDVLYAAGMLALQLKKYDETEEHLSQLISLNKRVFDSHYYLGQVAEFDKNYRQAIDHYLKVKRGEFYFSAQVRVVTIMADKGELENARIYLNSIRTHSAKQQVQLLLIDGEILRDAGKFAAAMAIYSKALERWPDETNLRYARALVAEKLDNLNLVESDLQNILVKEPLNAQALNALGYTLADRTTRYKEALGYITRALELQPGDAAVMDSMGWVHYRLGNHQLAIEHLKKASALVQDPEIAAHLGEVLWVMGKKTDALEVWGNSLAENPDHEILLHVMERFGL